MVQDTDTNGRPAQDATPVCAIGASAGGVRALSEFFRRIQPDLGIAYVIVVHLAPDHPSVLNEILQSCTSMNVVQVDDTPTLMPDCVYVIPPDRELVIKGNDITARPFTEARGRRAPIDMFFRSIASARGDGLAVILSGGGSDGANGVRAIKEAGGVIFVQDPAEAEFGMMPHSAIATGSADFVAPLPELVERIVEVVRSKEAVRSLALDGAANDLRRVVNFLRMRTGHDFSSYKRATIMRRVLRRVQVTRKDSLLVYAEYVRDNPEEAQLLFQDLLISVTMFFRDPKAFDALVERVLRPMIDQRSEGDGIRIWVVGCATGEEVYSLAILLLEEMRRRNIQVPIQIFATDLDEGALATARDGRYPRSIEADVSEERLQRFFVIEGNHYRIREYVRELVVFASHSVLRNPPFLRLDLITCRNLLIYLERDLQRQLFTMFHYGLKDMGCLFLGSAETVDAAPEIFAAVDRESRIYRSRPEAARHMPHLPTVATDQQRLSVLERPHRHEVETAPIAGGAHLKALERVAPPSLLVDDARRIVHLSPTVGRFLLHSGGPASFDVTSIIRPELRLDLKLAVERAFEKGEPTLSPPISVAFDGTQQRVAMLIKTVKAEKYSSRQVVVFFIDCGSVDGDTAVDSEELPVGSDEVRRLREELRLAHQRLSASRGQHELAIEDLGAANEELQSINEEYRSTSEELETSKEELQSMNEELQTVNAELKSKLENISTAHSDLQNLTMATEIGTLFIDPALRIRMFTAPVADIFSITTADVGRPITDFTNRLLKDGVDEDARRVLRDLAPVESEVETRDHRWFMLRLRPYRTIEDRIEGVVVTFVDITVRRDAEQRLRQSEERYRTLFNSIDEGFCVIDMIHDAQDRAVDYRFVDVNAAFERQTGLQDAIGKTIRALAPDHEEEWFEIYGRIATTGVPERFEHPAAALDRFYEVYAFKVDGGEGWRLGVLFNDISARKQGEQERELLTRELSHRVKNTLAVVQALANQTDGTVHSVDEFRKKFVGRLHALGNAHGILLEENWRGADLRQLVEQVVGSMSEQAVDIRGPSLALKPKQALGLSLLLHELSTNAAKYGALSDPKGRVSVSWQIENGDSATVVRIHWGEHDGPPIERPPDKGFGTKLIQRVCAYELDGEADISYARDGLRCDIVFPLEQSPAT